MIMTQKNQIIRFNQEPNPDPSNSLAIRKKFSNQQRRIFASALAYSQAEFAKPMWNNQEPTNHQVESYLAALLALFMMQLNTGKSIDPYVQAAYVRGVTNANIDLRASGVVIGAAATAVLTQGVHKFSIISQQDKMQVALRNVYTTMINNTREAIYEPSELTMMERVQPKLKRGLQLAGVVGGTVIVGIVADAFLNRVVDFGIKLVSPIVELSFTTAGDERVCPDCQALSEVDNGKGAGIYTIEQARGLIPVHYNCRCNWRISVLKQTIPLLRI